MKEARFWAPTLLESAGISFHFSFAVFPGLSDVLVSLLISRGFGVDVAANLTPVYGYTVFQFAHGCL